jgi:hypothetical protein
VNAEATRLVRFVLSIDLDSGCVNTALRRENNWPEHHAITTVSAALAVVHRPNVTVIVHIETVSRRPLVAEAVTHEGLGGDSQLFLTKHILQTAAGIVFLERNADFH